jgi:hypothetical protein
VQGGPLAAADMRKVQGLGAGFWFGVYHLAGMGGDPASEMRKVNNESHLLQVD